jgi:hypothetical protein
LNIGRPLLLTPKGDKNIIVTLTWVSQRIKRHGISLQAKTLDASNHECLAGYFQQRCIALKYREAKP